MVVDGSGALAAGGDVAPTGPLTAIEAIAAGEHGRVGGGQRVGLGLDCVPLDLDEVAVNRLGTPAALFVGLAELAALQLDGAHLAAGADDLDRGDEVLDLELLTEAVLDLLGRSRHLVARAAVGDGDLRGLAVDGGEAFDTARSA